MCGLFSLIRVVRRYGKYVAYAPSSWLVRQDVVVVHSGVGSEGSYHHGVIFLRID